MKKKFYRNSDLLEFSLPEFKITGIQFTGIHQNSRIPVCLIKFTVPKVVSLKIKILINIVQKVLCRLQQK